MKKTVVVGMSGGVDSSVAAALLLEAGYAVIGVTMKIYDYEEVGGNVLNESSCCGIGAINDARLVACKLGIPHYVLDFRETFNRTVIDNFVSEYLKGRTPNPCVICNKDVKWGELLKKADALGADFIATGHYARLSFDQTNERYVISKGKYELKDQSYALWGLTQHALSKTIFPLGDLTKPDVRAIAEKLGLRTADKEESFEICFVADNNYERFLKEWDPGLKEKLTDGEIVWDGKVVGRHSGYPFYTIGQRKGLGAFGQKVYVTKIDSTRNRIEIGTEVDLLHRELIAKNVNWVSIGTPNEPIRIEAKIRYKDEATPATVYLEGRDSIRVIFDAPKRAITPGQSIVMYQAEKLLGGGIIESVGKNESRD